MPLAHGFGPLRRLARKLRRFGRDDRGTTAVEFAMVSVPFLGLLFAIFQTAYLFMAQQAIDAAASNAGRNVMTGQTMSNNITTASAFATNVICPGSSNTTGWSLASFLTCSNLIIDVRPASTSGTWGGSSVDTAVDFLNGGSEFCIGNPGDIVIVRIIYPVPAFLSIMTLSKSISSGGIGKSTAGQQSQTSTGAMVYPIMGISAFRNEPFPSSSYTKPAGCP
jgi:Flp pilus assembly protein TadG